jgi:hypothetical protein
VKLISLRNESVHARPVREPRRASGICPFAQTKANTPVTLPADGLRPRPETRRFARILAATFGGLFLIILALIAIADHARP